MSSRWSLLERFEITDASGMPRFEARGHFGSQITLHDAAGQVVAEIRKHLFSDVHEIYLGGERVAQVRHAGFFGDRYEIATSYGQLTARGHFGGDYTLNQDGMIVASMIRQFSLREKFAIEIADGQSDAMLLAIMLAIEAIHDERRERR